MSFAAWFTAAVVVLAVQPIRGLRSTEHHHASAFRDQAHGLYETQPRALDGVADPERYQTNTMVYGIGKGRTRPRSPTKLAKTTPTPEKRPQP